MSNKVLRGLWFGVLGAGIIIFGLYIRQAVISLGQPYPFEYGEGWDLWVSNWIGNGGIGHLYPTASQSPYYSQIYPPLYFIVVGVFSKIFGMSLFIGRFVSFIACLASGMLVFFIVREVTKSKWFGLIGGILFFVPPITRAWTLFFKPEPLALCLTLLGFYLAIKYIGSRKVLWSVVPFILAVFTKQAYICAPLAVGLYLLFTNRKLMLQYGGTLLVSGLGLLGVFQLLTHGSFVSSILGSPTLFPVHWELALLLIRNTVVYHWIILILALCAVVLVLVRSKELREMPTMPILYFLVASFLFVMTTGKVGIWYSYSLEMLTVAMILIPVLAWKLSKVDTIRERVGVIVGSKTILATTSRGMLLQLAIPILLIIQMVSLPSFASWTAPNGHLRDSYEIVLSDLNSASSEILCEDGYLLYLSGRDPLYEPSYATNAVRHGGLDHTPVIDSIANKRYDLIIQEWDIKEFYEWPYDINLPDWVPVDLQREFTMHWCRCTYEMADAILDNYQLRHHVGRLWVYEPKP